MRLRNKFGLNDVGEMRFRFWSMDLGGSGATPVRLSRTTMNFRTFFIVDLESQRNPKTYNQHQLRQRRLENSQPHENKTFLWNATDTYSHFLNFYYFKFNDFYGSFVRSAHSSNAFEIGCVKVRATNQLITLSETEQQHRLITHTLVSCCCFYAYLFSFSIDLIKTFCFFWNSSGISIESFMSYLFVNKGTIKCAHTGTLRIQFSETKLSLDSSLFLVLLVIPADFTQTDRASNEPNCRLCEVCRIFNRERSTFRNSTFHIFRIQM